MENGITKSDKLFAQGMGGPSIGIKIPNEEIVKLKALYQTQNIGILSAKIRIYTDPSLTESYYKPKKYPIALKIDELGKLFVLFMITKWKKIRFNFSWIKWK